MASIEKFQELSDDRVKIVEKLLRVFNNHIGNSNIPRDRRLRRFNEKKISATNINISDLADLVESVLLLTAESADNPVFGLINLLIEADPNIIPLLGDRAIWHDILHAMNEHRCDLQLVVDCIQLLEKLANANPDYRDAMKQADCMQILAACQEATPECPNLNIDLNPAVDETESKEQELESMKSDSEQDAPARKRAFVYEKRDEKYTALWGKRTADDVENWLRSIDDGRFAGDEPWFNIFIVRFKLISNMMRNEPWLQILRNNELLRDSGMKHEQDRQCVIRNAEALIGERELYTPLQLEARKRADSRLPMTDHNTGRKKPLAMGAELEALREEEQVPDQSDEKVDAVECEYMQSLRHALCAIVVEAEMQPDDLENLGRFVDQLIAESGIRLPLSMLNNELQTRISLLQTTVAGAEFLRLLGYHKDDARKLPKHPLKKVSAAIAEMVNRMRNGGAQYV